MFDMVGGCASSKVALYQQLARPVASAILVEGAKQTPVPTYLKGYTPEARVLITYR
ncbi:hypothetical protein [uncultured Sphingomonas sp.]|uniref:hypothetical protein n=1 Tax=uncultured Sphingomonas sp. TaxID=158754 RepID=UPI0025D18A61|nr:hypothetical protein [uncultured Sphingomonas sp.]